MPEAKRASVLRDVGNGNDNHFFCGLSFIDTKLPER